MLHNAILGGYALLGTAPNRHYANFGWERVGLRSAPSEQNTPLAAVCFALMRQPSAPSIASAMAADDCQWVLAVFLRRLLKKL